MATKCTRHKKSTGLGNFADQDVKPSTDSEIKEQSRIKLENVVREGIRQKRSDKKVDNIS